MGPQQPTNTPEQVDPPIPTQPSNTTSYQGTPTQQVTPPVSYTAPATPGASVASPSVASEPVSSISPSMQAAPVQAFPQVAERPSVDTITAPSVVNKKPKKKLIIAAVIVAVLLLAGISYAVFSLWYNKPENVVYDSFVKAVSAKSGQGIMSLAAPFLSATVTTDLTYTYNESDEASATYKLKLSGNGTDLDINGGLAVDKNQTVYAKVANIRKTLEAMSKDQPESSTYIKMYDSFITAVDGKWISISEEDIKKLQGSDYDDTESKCIEAKLNELESSNKQQDEVRTLLGKNPFIVVKQVGAETVEGVYSNHYRLSADENKAKAFAKGLKTLTVFKNIDGCVEADLAKQFDEAAKDEKTNIKDDTYKTTVDYWVGMWSHEPVKLVAFGKGAESTTRLELKPKLNTKPTVTIPKADKSIIELQQELEKATDSLIQPGSLQDL